MIQLTVHLEGMAYGMHEAHVNDAVRRAFPVKKVIDSHKKKQTVILAEQTILLEENLKYVTGKAGYDVVSVSSEPYRKKICFRRSEDDLLHTAAGRSGNDDE